MFHGNLYTSEKTLLPYLSGDVNYLDHLCSMYIDRRDKGRGREERGGERRREEERKRKGSEEGKRERGERGGKEKGK